MERKDNACSHKIEKLTTTTNNLQEQNTKKRKQINDNMGSSTSKTAVATTTSKTTTTTTIKSKYPIIGPTTIMNPKKHGTSDAPVQHPLRWNVSRKEADRICNYNRHYAESFGTAFSNLEYKKNFKKLDVTVRKVKQLNIMIVLQATCYLKHPRDVHMMNFIKNPNNMVGHHLEIKKSIGNL